MSRIHRENFVNVQQVRSGLSDVPIPDRYVVLFSDDQSPFDDFPAAVFTTALISSP